MPTNELIAKIKEFQIRSSNVFFSEGELPNIINLKSTSSAFEVLQSLIDFIFVDHRYYHSAKNFLHEFSHGDSYEARKLREIDDERREINIGELNDLFMDIGCNMIEEFAVFYRSSNFSYDDTLKIHNLKQKINRLFITREHNLHSVYLRLAEHLRETMEILTENSDKPSVWNKGPAYDIDKIIFEVHEILKSAFSGYNSRNRKIMAVESYQKLVNYTIYLIKHDKLPPNIESIQNIDLTGQFILMTYRSICDKLGKDKSRRRLFCIFVYMCFDQFKNCGFSQENYKDSVIYKKFTRPNKAYESELKMFTY